MEKSFKNFNQFRKELLADPALQQEFQKDPINAVKQLGQSALSSDVWVYRIVVSTLGLTILVIVVGTILLISNGQISEDKNIPTIVTAIGSAAIGALASLLSQPPKND